MKILVTGIDQDGNAVIKRDFDLANTTLQEVFSGASSMSQSQCYNFGNRLRPHITRVMYGDTQGIEYAHGQDYGDKVSYFIGLSLSEVYARANAAFDEGQLYVDLTAEGMPDAIFIEQKPSVSAGIV